MKRLPAILTGGGLLLASAGVVLSDTPTLTPHSPATEGFGLRRVPVLASRSVSRAEMIKKATAAATSINGCASAVEHDGAPLLSVNLNEGLIPASTIKLVTGIAALVTLGEDATIPTEVLAKSADVKKSVDELWIRGHGDPSWSTPDFLAWEKDQPFGKGAERTSIDVLAQKIKDSGITKIDRLSGDDTALQGPPFQPEWKSSYRSDGEVGAIDALTINRGLAQYRGTRVVPEDGTSLFLEKLSESLKDIGVEVGEVGRDTAPPDAQVVLTHQSPPIHALVASMLTTSDNLAAELMLRYLGSTKDNPTTAGGAAVAKGVLTSLDISTDGFVQVDGSGLARENRLSCATLQEVVLVLHERYAATESLAIAGVDGTLAGVSGDTRNRLVAKTGSLSGVSALGGFVLPVPLPEDADPDSLLSDPEVVSFAVIFNDSFSESAGSAARIALAEALLPIAPLDPSTILPAPISLDSKTEEPSGN